MNEGLGVAALRRADELCFCDRRPTLALRCRELLPLHDQLMSVRPEARAEGLEFKLHALALKPPMDWSSEAWLP